MVYSGQVLLDLVSHGILREEAYRMVQRHAMEAWKNGLNFRDLVLSDPEITRRVPRKELEAAFDLNRQLRNVDAIFARVFGKSSTSSVKAGWGKAGAKKSIEGNKRRKQKQVRR